MRTKRGADRLVENLGKEGIKAAAIHGDLRQANRERALADFSNGKLAVLVATDVAARGLHIDGVDGVIHFDPPEDHKAYLHRSGRTARAGKAGVVVSLSLWNQLVEMEVIQRRLGLRIPIVEMFSNDPRLADLAAWTPLTRGERPLSEDAAGPDLVARATGCAGSWSSPPTPTTSTSVRPARWPPSPPPGSRSPTASSPTATPAARTAPCRGPRWPRSARTSSGPPRPSVGVSDVRFLGHPDGTVAGHPASCGATSAGSSARCRPERVVTQSPERNWEFIYASHPDHLATGEAAVCAVYPDARNPFAHPELLDVEGLEPWTVPELWIMGPAAAPSSRRGGRHHGHGRAQGGRAPVPQEPDADPDGVAPAGARLGAWPGASRPGFPRARSAELFRVIRIP